MVFVYAHGHEIANIRRITESRAVKKRRSKGIRISFILLPDHIDSSKKQMIDSL